ncbi:Glycine/D-amino acid oxidase-like deaminating enzyme [Paraburkholderia unamae]|uniref:NAD(P)/FAD-dependent oxidoreductase n=1 Tax=Paraburkholderia unamae TaxID=219649 RepID=UPI001CB244AB|nr:FAD-binding oxidoreductase [Paraburkholderia unamae]CAG9247327.1 Glycine/D-amino acid oxidase-like deaminating enzyme [Paraburkholderia unamae]
MADPNLDSDRFPPSLWAATTAAAVSTAPLPPGTYFADLLVIGAGFTGLSAALRAAERGSRVVVLEAAEIGWGASGRNNGQVIPAMTRADPDAIVAEYGAEKGEALVSLIGESANTVFDLARRHRMDCGAVQAGWIQPAHRASRLGLARSRVEQWRRCGVEAELLDRDRTAELTGSSFWHGGWQNMTGGHLNPLAFVRGLARAAQDAGACIHTRTPVSSLTRESAHWVAAHGDARVQARRVLIATHSYTGRPARAPWPGIADALLPMRSYQMATQPLPAHLRASILPHDHAMSDTQSDLHFARFDREGRLVTGGALVVPFGYEDRLRRRIDARVRRMFPQLDGLPLRFEYLWHGDFAVTPDRMPRFAKLGDGLYTWYGCNGRGVALSTAVGAELADVALSGDERGSRLPFSTLRPIAAHALVERLAIGAMLYYRWKDQRD